MYKDRVNFEQAEALAELYCYNGKHHHCYDVEDHHMHESQDKIDHNRNKVCTGRGWKYFHYSAPTKDEAIMYLMDLCSHLERKCEEYNEKLIKLQCQK